jgi:uncharacterized protein (UPF0248 family)
LRPKSNQKKGRKGSLEETLSYALYRDKPESFSVAYRDKERIKTAALKVFLENEEMSDIPLTRILSISKNETIVWKRGQKEVWIKDIDGEGSGSVSLP